MSDQIRPGVMRCAKCSLVLLQSVMNARTGAMTANTDPVRCPNECGPMWHVTWKEAAQNAEADAVKAFDRIASLERELSEAKERIETIRKKARDDVLEEAHRWRKEILITQLQDACDIYIKHHKKPESDEPHNFVLWLPKELERREALAELKKELGI